MNGMYSRAGLQKSLELLASQQSCHAVHKNKEASFHNAGGSPNILYQRSVSSGSCCSSWRCCIWCWWLVGTSKASDESSSSSEIRSISAIWEGRPLSYLDTCWLHSSLIRVRSRRTSLLLGASLKASTRSLWAELYWRLSRFARARA